MMETCMSRCECSFDSAGSFDGIRAFNKYLVFYGPTEGKCGVKGIRSDAPQEAIDAFVDWYRKNNRYENGRLRPLSDAMVRKLLIDPSD
jgi:hypothetical protein